MNASPLYQPFENHEIRPREKSAQSEHLVGSPEHKRMAGYVTDAILGVVYHDEHLVASMTEKCKLYCAAQGITYLDGMLGIITGDIVESFPMSKLKEADAMFTKHATQSEFAEKLEREHQLPSETNQREQAFAGELVQYVFGDFEKGQARASL